MHWLVGSDRLSKVMDDYEAVLALQLEAREQAAPEDEFAAELSTDLALTYLTCPWRALTTGG